MTIVVSYKNQRKLNLTITFLAVFLVFAIALGLFWYNQIVNLTHELETKRVELQAVQASNAELKQQVYNLVSYENLEKVALARGMVKDKNPEYLDLTKLDSRWLFASHF